MAVMQLIDIGQKGGMQHAVGLMKMTLNVVGLVYLMAGRLLKMI